MTKVEFFYDLTSPWTYLAYDSILDMSARLDVPIIWRPHLVGGVFNAVNQDVYKRRDTDTPSRKMTYALYKDLGDWARYQGLTINFPPKAGHPVNAVKCMRGAIHVQQQGGDLAAYNTAMFQALWRDGLDLAQDAVLADICTGLGIEPNAFLRAIAEQPVKDALRANTDELIERGAFGSPTIFVNDTDMYFGNDRMVLVERAIMNDRAGT